MTPEAILQLLKSQFPNDVLETVTGSGHPRAVVSSTRWLELATFLRDDGRLKLNSLRCISSVDLLAENKLACVYDLLHVPMENLGKLITKTYAFAVQVNVDRSAPVMPSVAGIWAAADWHEREAYDLMGIVFSGHPNLQRILCPDDWVGYPLRKDYEFPLMYQDIPATTEYELTNPRH